MNDKLSQILLLIDEYITDKNASAKWEAGKDWVQYSGPVFNSKEYIAAVESLLGGWLVLGKDAITFESKFPKLLGKEYGILTNSGSSSNLIMVSALKSKRAFKFKEGDKVITPIAGFPTTLNPIIQNNLKPLFVDIELDTLNLDLDQVEQRAKEGAKAIAFAHVLGNSTDMSRLMSIVEKYKLVLLEDCCDALGSTYDSKPLGSFGDMASCSFYPAHHITMGEGGFVACKDKNLEVVTRSFREWGRGCFCVGKKANLLKNGSCGNRFSNWLEAFPDKIFDHKYIYDEIGYNLKPIEMQASIGLCQLDKLDEITLRRNENYAKLFSIFEEYEEHFILPRPRAKVKPSWFAFPLTIKNNAPFDRFAFCNYLEDHKIQTRTYFGGNLGLQPAYSDMISRQEALSYKNATKATVDTFFLGTSPVITECQIQYVKSVVNKFFKEKV